MYRYILAFLVCTSLPAFAQTLDDATMRAQAEERRAQQMRQMPSVTSQGQGVDVQRLSAEWQALAGSLQALVRSREHTETELQRALSQWQEDARMRADAESRLKWVLDNWVPKHPVAEAKP